MDASRNGAVQVEFRPRSELGTTEVEGLSGTHHFCFATYQRPDRLEWGGLRALHRYHLAAGGRREPSFHAGFEIITLVGGGALRRIGTFVPRQLLLPGSIELVSTGVGAQLGLEAVGDAPADYIEIWLNSHRSMQDAARHWRPATSKQREQILAAAPPLAGSLTLATRSAEIVRVWLGQGETFVRQLSPDTCAYLAVTHGRLVVGQTHAMTGDAFAISGPGELRASGAAGFLYIATSKERPTR